jgi:outer membrane protein assembly complex protein YaeT
MGTKVLTRLILLALLLAICAPLWAQEEDSPPPAKKAFLDFQGNNIFTDKELLKATGLEFKKKWYILKQKKEISGEEAEEIVNELTIFYKREGYFDISIKKIETEKTFQIMVFEGPVYNISEFSLTLEADEETASGILSDVKEDILMKTGVPFKVADYEAAQPMIEKAFGDAGFPFVKVTPSAEVDVIAKTVKVRISVNQGFYALFGSLAFEGIINSEERMLRKLVKFKEGEPYKLSQVDETKDAFYKTGLFDVVTIKVRKIDPEGKVPIKIILKEGRHRKIKLSFGYGSDEKLRFQAGWETLRLRGHYINAGYNFKKSHLETAGEAHLRRPYFIEKYTFFAVIKQTRLHWIQTDFDSLILSTGLERKFGDTVMATLEGSVEKIERIHFTYPEPRVAPDALTPWSFSLKLNVAKNTTDNQLDPRKGYILQGSIEPTVVKDVSVSFTKLYMEYRRFWEIKDDMILAVRFKAATILTNSPIGKIPYPYRFFTGGQMKLRGYSFSSVSPQEKNGALQGGLGLFESSVEYRFPLKGDFKGLVFLDAGKASSKNLPLKNLGNINYGTGFGVRYMTGVGPIGLDIAFRLNKAPYSSSPYQIALFIGYAF